MDPSTQETPEQQPTQPDQPNTTPVDAPTPVQTPAASLDTEPRNFLAALMITMLFGMYGLHKFYLRDKRNGWIRFGLLILATILSISIIGRLLLLILAVWVVVDFVRLYSGNRVDTQNIPLSQTNYDNKWARVLYIINVIALIFSALAFFIGITMGALFKV